jgi:hypothetical protein
MAFCLSGHYGHAKDNWHGKDMMAAAGTSTDQAAEASQSVSSAQTCDALELGWHIAELYHWPAGLETEESSSIESRLPRQSDLSPRAQARLLSQQIGAAAKRIISPAQDPVTQSIAAVSSLLTNDNKPSIENLRQDASTLHRQILQAITIQSSVLSKAYSLGQTLAEISLVAGTGTSTDMELVKNFFSTPTIRPVYLWLSELKSLLPPHAAYAVSRTLEDWRIWVTSKAEPQLTSGAEAMVAQGRVWRELLTGEKNATDLLNIGNYLRAAQEIFARVLASVKRYWYLICIIAAVVAGVCAFIIELDHVSTTTKFIANFVWLAGVFGLSVKGFGNLLGTALKNAEGWLWQGELDESVAEAAAHLPPRVEYKRLTGNNVGNVIPAALLSPEPLKDDGASS